MAITRQRRWQLKMATQGRCVLCGKRAATRQHCKWHARDNADRTARRLAQKPPDPTVARARNAVNSAVRDGRLIRPTVCTRCGIHDPKINGHHHDYSKPLEVTWLCYRCHSVVEGRGK